MKMMSILGLVLSLVLGTLGNGAEKAFAQVKEADEFTWTGQQLECEGPASGLHINMREVLPLARISHNYETGSAVCNFDSRSPQFQCVGFWYFKKDPLQVNVKVSRNSVIATAKASPIYGSKLITYKCKISTKKNLGREKFAQ